MTKSARALCGWMLMCRCGNSGEPLCSADRGRVRQTHQVMSAVRMLGKVVGSEIGPLHEIRQEKVLDAVSGLRSALRPLRAESGITTHLMTGVSKKWESSRFEASPRPMSPKESAKTERRMTAGSFGWSSSERMSASSASSVSCD